MFGMIAQDLLPYIAPGHDMIKGAVKFAVACFKM
jgi:hypothetical protein